MRSVAGKSSVHCLCSSRREHWQAGGSTSYPANGQGSNPRSELTFVRAQCFTNFSIKVIYTLRSESHNQHPSTNQRSSFCILSNIPEVSLVMSGMLTCYTMCVYHRGASALTLTYYTVVWRLKGGGGVVRFWRGGGECESLGEVGLWEQALCHWHSGTPRGRRKDLHIEVFS